MGIEDERGKLRDFPHDLQKLTSEQVGPRPSGVSDHAQESAGLAQVATETFLDGDLAGQPGLSLGLFEVHPVERHQAG